MVKRIDYQIEKYVFSDIGESPRITRQWAEVAGECLQQKAGSEERLRIALLNVDYVTSFELPFRLLLIRAPQLIDRLREELSINQKSVTINGKNRGCVYSLTTDLSKAPDSFRYRFSNRIQRVEPSGPTAAPYLEIAKQTKEPRERLRLALAAGLEINALDGLFWLSIQRIAADVSVLRKAGMVIVTSEIEVFDTLTGTVRRISSYRLKA